MRIWIVLTSSYFCLVSAIVSGEPIEVSVISPESNPISSYIDAIFEKFDAEDGLKRREELIRASKIFTDAKTTYDNDYNDVHVLTVENETNIERMRTLKERMKMLEKALRNATLYEQPQQELNEMKEVLKNTIEKQKNLCSAIDQKTVVLNEARERLFDSQRALTAANIHQKKKDHRLWASLLENINDNITSIQNQLLEVIRRIEIAQQDLDGYNLTYEKYSLEIIEAQTSGQSADIIARLFQKRLLLSAVIRRATNELIKTIIEYDKIVMRLKEAEELKSHTSDCVTNLNRAVIDFEDYSIWLGRSKTMRIELLSARYKFFEFDTESKKAQIRANFSDRRKLENFTELVSSTTPAIMQSEYSTARSIFDKLESNRSRMTRHFNTVLFKERNIISGLQASRNRVITSLNSAEHCRNNRRVYGRVSIQEINLGSYSPITLGDST